MRISFAEEGDALPSSYPPMRQHFISIADAEQWASQRGVNATYGVDLQIADLCNEYLARLQDAHLRLPEEIRVIASHFRSMRYSTDIPASSAQAILYINPSSNFWHNPIQASILQKRLASWSTGSPFHPLDHEAGHFLLYLADSQAYDDLRERPLTAKQQTRARYEVSMRAIHDIYEFMSEVFAMLINRVPVPKGILRLYMDREGVVPWSE